MRDPNRRRCGAGSAGGVERTRILVPAEQGNRVRVPDTEGISFLRLQPMNHRVQRRRQNSESSCISKVLFSMRGIPACGENRSLEGLSWPGEKAEAMRLRRKRTQSQRQQGFTRMNGSVRRPTKSKTGELRASQQGVAMLKSYQMVCTAKICHRSDDCRNHRFCHFCGSLSLR